MLGCRTYRAWRDADARYEEELAFVPTYEVSAAAGDGIIIDNEYETGRLAFRHD